MVYTVHTYIRPCLVPHLLPLHAQVCDMPGGEAPGRLRHQPRDGAAIEQRVGGGVAQQHAGAQQVWVQA